MLVSWSPPPPPGNSARDGYTLVVKKKGDTKEVLQRKTGRGEVKIELDCELLHPGVEYVVSLYTRAKAETESETDALDVKEVRHSESSPAEQTFMFMPPPRDLQLESTSTSSIKVIICLLEVFQDGSPLGLLDFVLRAFGHSGRVTQATMH